ncbi:MAG: phosphate signaling complex protein PhoU [Bacteroidetes bacterium]|nr:phosphate signaling complex protein PhoU [Bacteroidota bacterium]
MQEEVRNTGQLKLKLLHLSALVEEITRRSVIAFRTRDRVAAVDIIKADEEINRLEIAIEKDCIALLTGCTLSKDETRFIVAVLKINNDLERIGDLASNVARRVLHIGQHDMVLFPQELLSLADAVLDMLTTSLDALVDGDIGRARAVFNRDNEVDALNRRMYDVVRERIVADPSQTDKLINFLSISRYLERIGDYATNLAESVVFIAEGNIIRHQNNDMPGGMSTGSNKHISQP